MAKKRAASSSGIAIGTFVRVKEGVTSPDMPDFPLAGWTGAIAEVAKKKPPRKYMVEWDQKTLDGMPAEYLQFCEQKQLYHLMICLAEDEIEPAEAG
jgi:hypothetical protein